MGPSFSEQFDQYGQWRKGFAEQLAALGEWLAQHELLDSTAQGYLQGLEQQLRGDRLYMAFVSDFSRGKSELINAVFFAHYGRRIMPSAVGRTTMCATELSYDPALAPCLRLLPVETRAQPYSLEQWRSRPSTWVELPLDVHDADQLAQAMASVAQMQKVTVQVAKDLGFWSDAPDADNPVCDAQGLVAIPKWRYALINMAHPLLQQGLVILDTPGLNAVGTEPELTVNMIAQAHSVVFLLAADAGVTPSDLAIWQEHLLPSHRAGNAHVVVLNKIDTLWREGVSDAQAQAQLEQLRLESAQLLGVDPARVVPVSARRALQTGDGQSACALEQSGVAQLENLLAQGILQHRQQLLREVMSQGLAQLHTHVLQAVQLHQRDAQDGQQMLQQLSPRGVTGQAMPAVADQLQLEQQLLAAADVHIASFRAAHLRLMHQAFQHLGATAQRKELDQLTAALEYSGLAIGVRQVYASGFERFVQMLEQTKAATAQVQQLLQSYFAQFNADFGFDLQTPSAMQWQAWDEELTQIQESYLQYLDFGYAMKLAHPLFKQRMVTVLGMRLNSLFQAVAQGLDGWSKSATTQLDAQSAQRKRSLLQRREMLDALAADRCQVEAALAGALSRQQHWLQIEQQLQQTVHQLQQLRTSAVQAATAAVAEAVL